MICLNQFTPRLRLDNLELSANNFDPACAPRTLRDRLEPVSSLLELAAVQVVTRNITVTEEDVGPRLLAYLDSGDPAVIILCFIFELCSFVYEIG